MSSLSDKVSVGRSIERWALEAWANRGWDPSEDETARLADLRQTDHGQVLMRLLDQASLDALASFAYRGDAANPVDIALAQGRFDAFQRVMNWLLTERDELLEHEDLTLTEDDDDA